MYKFEKANVKKDYRTERALGVSQRFIKDIESSGLDVVEVTNIPPNRTAYNVQGNLKRTIKSLGLNWGIKVIDKRVYIFTNRKSFW